LKGIIVRTRQLLSSVSLALLLAVGVAQAQSAKKLVDNTFPLVKPESVGFSSKTLSELDKSLKDIVDKGHLSGVVTMLARHGEVVMHTAHGYQDIDKKTPMQLDSIVRIYSMTKPITGAALMMLYEEGKWQPSDPIAKHIPEFANLKVHAGVDSAGKPILVEPTSPPTIGQLMSHNAGFTYGLFGNTPVDQLYRANNPLLAPSLKGMIDRLANLPLLYQPGEKWVYSLSVDIQGYLVEKLSGMPFPQFLEQRMFAPLGMKDTAFLVPKDKLSRVATIYAWDNNKKVLAAQPNDPAISEMPGLPQGGGGLYSTAADYLRFAQMMANGGELNGTRILKPSSVAMMRTNVLNDTTLNSKSGVGAVRSQGASGIQPGLGFGYDFAVITDPVGLKSSVGKGTYWWWGIAGTWFWIDPTNDVVFISLIQRRGGVPGAADHESISRELVYKALTHPNM
jgi:CubicO group peptidase (beta-lactamase class C family)